MRLLLGVAVATFLTGLLVGSAATAFRSRDPTPPPAGVVRYLDGMRHWDGRAVWESYSSDYQNLLTEEGGGEASTIALYDELREQGASIDDVSYVGGYQTRETGCFLFVTRHFADKREPIEVIWIFRTDPDGLIESID
jgi:hypothetical protein